MDLVSVHDLVVDACDNPRTRYVINDACVLAELSSTSAADIEQGADETTADNESSLPSTCSQDVVLVRRNRQSMASRNG